jgi:hypothetical protein
MPFAAASATLRNRAEAMLEELGRTVVFDTGWLAVRDPEQHRHVPVATSGAAQPLHEYFRRPEADAEVELLGLNRRRPPMLASEIPISLTEVCAWADYLLPAGFRQGIAAGLFTTGGRHVGFLSLLSADPTRPNRADRQVVAAITTAIADVLDRTQDIARTARLVRGARAGTVLTRAGDVLPLPGLPGDRLLDPGSPALAIAARELASGGACTSFLTPTRGEQLTPGRRARPRPPGPRPPRRRGPPMPPTRPARPRGAGAADSGPAGRGRHHRPGPRPLAAAGRPGAGRRPGAVSGRAGDPRRHHGGGARGARRAAHPAHAGDSGLKWPRWC